MSNEIERAKINLENLRNDLAQFIRDRDHAIELIKLREADIKRVENWLRYTKYPIYETNIHGQVRRVIEVDRRYITLRWDTGLGHYGGIRTTFRRTDGRPKHTATHTVHERINLGKAISVWNDYVAAEYTKRTGFKAPVRPALGRAEHKL